MENIIVVRGAGDLSTAIIHRLNRCGFKVVALEIDKPLAIRREVAFSEAVYTGEMTVEGVNCKLCKTIDEIEDTINNKNVALVVDAKGEYIKKLNPSVVIDAILAKKNLGTTKDMANLTIGLGPGFCAGEDVDIVVETMRGHNLGRVITEGFAMKNTGVPGSINGISKDRVVYSNSCGEIKTLANIGDIVKKNQVLAYIIDEKNNKHEVKATIDGLLRGIIRDGAIVPNNLKILDIDPRLEELKNSYTISDKGRCISGGVLEAILSNCEIFSCTKKY
ncbi:selenium-dependent molybdenum cofactor biosynthesis protein YqeB [[Clostridium] dakarense]|uniref:selenium-dependent molybdenum cofactor biosynthesis protein YqeB n=1 Tax=Faecalimicrobium dakarense TaxID=1301100 RepID=UPI0004AEDE49|nr:selenium-dependent molybdenum cofactor biosynthesis protein YqeB [[Clostridium] dakarense]